MKIFIFEAENDTNGGPIWYINHVNRSYTTLFFKQNAAWKVAFLFGKSVDR